MGVITAEDPAQLASPLVDSDAERQCEAAAETPEEEVPTDLAPVPRGGEEGGAQSRTFLESLRIEELLRILQPYVEKYGHWFSAVQPWREFVHFAWPRGCSEVRSRVKSNLRTYWANYAVIGLACLGAVIVMCPPVLLAVLLLGFVWSVVLKRMDDPAWTVKIGSYELGRDRQMALFGSVTVLAMLLFVAPLLLGVVMNCTPVILMHTVLHPARDDNVAKLATGPDVEEGKDARQVVLPVEAEAATESAE